MRIEHCKSCSHLAAAQQSAILHAKYETGVPTRTRLAATMRFLGSVLMLEARLQRGLILRQDVDWLVSRATAGSPCTKRV